jgi:hypothetical protein
MLFSAAFGSTNTLNPISTLNGFCDREAIQDNQGDQETPSRHHVSDRPSTLACLVSNHFLILLDANFVECL